MPLGTRQSRSSGDNSISICLHFTDKKTESLKDEESRLKPPGRSVVKQGGEAHAPASPAGPAASVMCCQPQVPALITQVVGWQTQIWGKELARKIPCSKRG